MIPGTSSISQLSQVISQAAAPGFILSALAAFISLLIARQNRIVDRTIVPNGISDDDPVKSRLKADLPRLLRCAAMMNRAILWALISSIAIAVLVVVASTSALLHIQHEIGVAILFIVALVAFTISLVEFAREVVDELPVPFDAHYADVGCAGAACPDSPRANDEFRAAPLRIAVRRSEISLWI